MQQNLYTTTTTINRVLHQMEQKKEYVRVHKSVQDSDRW